MCWYHGDTATTFAASLAAYYEQIQVGHVEAGLRTGNIYSPWPEEGSHKLTGAIADLHFAYEINGQLSSQGLYIKSGGVSIVDASIIETKQCRSNKDKNGESTQDPEAQWNVKAGSEDQRKSTYGFKIHVNIDEDGLIKSADYTPGNVHDSNCNTPITGRKTNSLTSCAQAHVVLLNGSLAYFSCTMTWPKRVTWG